MVENVLNQIVDIKIKHGQEVNDFHALVLGSHKRALMFQVTCCQKTYCSHCLFLRAQFCLNDDEISGAVRDVNL